MTPTQAAASSSPVSRRSAATAVREPGLRPFQPGAGTGTPPEEFIYHMSFWRQSRAPSSLTWPDRSPRN